MRSPKYMKYTSVIREFKSNIEVQKDGKRIRLFADYETDQDEQNGNAPCYTFEEWQNLEKADWELKEGELLFQGRVPVGTYSWQKVKTY